MLGVLSLGGRGAAEEDATRPSEDVRGGRAARLCVAAAPAAALPRHLGALEPVNQTGQGSSSTVETFHPL